MDKLYEPLLVKISDYKDTESRATLIEKVRDRVREIEREKPYYGSYSDEQIKNCVDRGLTCGGSQFKILFSPNFGTVI